MSNFINNFQKFISKNWNSPEEKEIVDYFKLNYKKIIQDENIGIQFITDFINNNKYMTDLTSEDFISELNNLDSDFLTEGDDGYHGYWEETALLIFNKSKNPNSHQPISAENVQRIKNIAKEYGTIIQSPPGPQDNLILPRIQIGQIRDFEMDIKSISRNLRIKIHTTNRNFNIADKINTGEISENKKIMNKDIKVGLKNWNITVNGNKIIVKEGKNIYEPFRQKNGQVVWDAPHTIPFIIKENVSDISMMLQENDTSDINVPEIPATNSEALNRVSRFDPYGNAQNIVKGSKTKIKFDKVEFKESVSKLDINKLFVIDEDLTEDTGMYSNLLIENKGKQQHLKIDKKDFSKFIQRNCNVKDYVTESIFDMNRYISSRPKGVINNLIKEYFEAQNSEKNDLHIDGVSRDDGEITILYYFDQDEQSTEVKLPEEAFFFFCQENDPNVNDYVFEEEDGNEDHPMGFGISFDEEMYWLQGDVYEMAKKYVENIIKK